MYEIEETSKDKLEEICDLRQPVLFDFDNKKIMELSNRDYLAKNYPAFELKIRNIKDDNNNSELYIPLPFHAATKLFDEDSSGTYFSENNTDFLQETGVIKSLQYNDEFIRPYMVSNCNYDVLLGSAKTWTPFRYEINYRNYFLLTQGTCQIKLAPPQSTKYLYPCYDYDNFEFRSPVNPWNPQTKFVADFDKMKCLEFTLVPGKTIFIPAYWWYSIKLDKDTSLSCFRYRTYMNNIAISPYIAMYALQMQNVKRDVVKKIDIKQLTLENIATTKKEMSSSNENNTSSTIDNLLPEKNDEPIALNAVSSIAQ
jgi:hypothetical protein